MGLLSYSFNSGDLKWVPSASGAPDCSLSLESLVLLLFCRSLLSLFSPVSYFVLFISEVTAEASPLSFSLLSWSTQSLFWQSTPATWDLGWKAEGGTTFQEIAHQGSLECVCGLDDVGVQETVPSSEWKRDPFLQILGYPSLYLSFFIALVLRQERPKPI